VAAAVAEVGEVATESLGLVTRWSSRPQAELRRLFERLRNPHVDAFQASHVNLNIGGRP